MKFKITVDGHPFEVEVGSLDARPILATVDGETFEVWPEQNQVSPVTAGSMEKEALPAPPAKAQSDEGQPLAKSAPAGGGTLAGGRQGSALKAVSAPIPGVITKILVHAGDEVNIGQELCVLEAMKMNNSIRSSRAGQIAAVRISVGQHVRHGEVLLEYAS